MMYSKRETALDFGRFFISTLVFAIYYLLWKLIRTLNNLTENLTINKKSRANGTRIGRIIWRRKLAAFIDSSPLDFLSLHYAPIDPEYVLKDNVSLYCVTKQEAIFVETPEHDNIYNSDENPFFYMAQFSRCSNVIRMSIETFHKMATKIGDPEFPVIWISSTGRCGSTLLCQIFEGVPGTLCLAEPLPPQNIALSHKFHEITSNECEQSLRSTVRVLCKPHAGIRMMCIKATPAALPLMSTVSRLFPTFKHVFSYRNCHGTVSSWLGLMTAIPYTVVLRSCIDNERFSDVVPLFRNHFINMLIVQKDWSTSSSLKTNTIGLFTHMWANFMLIARDALSSDKTIIPVEFEDLYSSPLDVSSKLFAKLELERRYLKQAAAAFERDSQRGSIVSQSLVKNDPRRGISETDRRKANAILSMYKLPHMDEDFRLFQ